MKAEEMAFRTIVEVPKWRKPMQKSQHYVLLGSCFAQNMGELFQSYDLRTLCNPLGVAYNPESISIQIHQALLQDAEIPTFRSDQGWRCWWASSVLSDTDETRFSETVHRTFSKLGEALREADFLFLTLGTSVYYELRENGMTVANCHKAPDRLFEQKTLDTDACIAILRDTMELLQAECPKLQVVFTVSPYRYKKYGFHGSNLAKATLLLAVDEICKQYAERAIYFPAYEILLDELRDYRFYADDMIHPAPSAVNYIWQRLTESCMDEEMQQYLKDYESIRKAKMHRICITPTK